MKVGFQPVFHRSGSTRRILSQTTKAGSVESMNSEQVPLHLDRRSNETLIFEFEVYCFFLRSHCPTKDTEKKSLCSAKALRETSLAHHDFQKPLHYVSVNSKPDPRGFTRSDCPRGRVFAQLSLPGGRGFELKKFSAVLKQQCRNFSICFKETGGSLKSRCSCAVSYQFLQK